MLSFLVFHEIEKNIIDYLSMALFMSNISASYEKEISYCFPIKEQQISSGAAKGAIKGKRSLNTKGSLPNMPKVDMKRGGCVV